MFNILYSLILLDEGYSHKFASSFSSGRELFLSDASLFVDDAEAYDKYQREEEVDADPKVTVSLVHLPYLI